MASIRDVAARAGVAISTVSKVLNNYPGVSARTRDKVNQAVNELGFVPNSVAAALSSKQTSRTALLMDPGEHHRAADEIDMKYLSGAISEAMTQGMDVITVFYSMIRDRTADEVIAYLQAQSISGLIIFGIDQGDRLIRELTDRQVFRIVAIDATIVNSRTSSICIDQRRAQYDIAAKTLRENRADSLLYIAGDRDEYVARERLEGIRKLSSDKNVSVTVRWGGFSELQARMITMKYARKKGIVVCASDLMAIGAMRALIEMDIFRPVCGFGGITLMAYAGKQMNTVRQDFSSISAQAVREVKRLIDGGEGRLVRPAYELVRIGYMDYIN
jgi:LacI family transcriptional regulator